LVSKLQLILKKEGVFTWKDSGACYDIPTTEGTSIYVPNIHYVDDLLNKYLG
jgi:hypothetical protein